MSRTSFERAKALYGEVMEYFDKIEEVAIPKAHDDLETLQQIKNGAVDAGLTDRHVNLIFKDKRMLKAAKNAEKFMRKRKRSKEKEKGEEEEEIAAEDDDEAEEDEQTFENQSVCNAMRNASYGYFPAAYKMNDSDRQELIARAKDHMAYLRRLRSKPWDKLSETEQRRIETYMQETTRFVQHLESKKDYMDFLQRALPLLGKIETLSKEVEEDTTILHRVENNVEYEDADCDKENPLALQTTASAAEKQVAALPAATLHTHDHGKFVSLLDNYVLSNDAHRELATHMRELQQVVEYTLSLYGDVRGSGTIVQKPEIPVARVAPPPPEQQETTLVSKGLMCGECGIMRVIDEHQAIATCPQCGVAKEFQGLGERNFNFGDKPMVEQKKEKNYVPRNYLLQWLRKVKGDLKTDIPAEVWQLLFRQFHLKRLRVVNPKIVRNVLKTHNLTQYYNSVPFITYKFNEVPLADFSEEEELIMVQRFAEYKEAFHRCPMEIRQRSNLLSYAYFCYKTVELLGWAHYKKCFPLLEGATHLRKHDQTWKWICENKKGEPWAFIPTFF